MLFSIQSLILCKLTHSGKLKPPLPTGEIELFTKPCKLTEYNAAISEAMVRCTK